MVKIGVSLSSPISNWDVSLLCASAVLLFLVKGEQPLALDTGPCLHTPGSGLDATKRPVYPDHTLEVEVGHWSTTNYTAD